ncbi:diguanylate cyclase [Noviherbaspirillum sp.]|uniref:sensor domain-containing diguanylate cyclase n=1 Tax=Noviherbaspirillum sp. TaxID=1926288 RepID=UPI002D63939C|nr:diguanylate cyclase [Noviherbaspirillum sp.]HZW20360.1 diguanylate cyclase [Noviherbaspirillum sp.]
MNQTPGVVSATPLSQTAPSLPLRPVRMFLIYLVLACVVPGIIGAALLVYHEYRESRAAFERNAFQTTRALAQAVDSHLHKAQAVAQSLSTSDALRRKDFAALYRQAREFLTLNPIGNSIALSDTSGQQIINLSRDFGQPLPKHGNLEQIRRVVESREPAISGVFKGAVAQQLLMTVDVPVIHDGQVDYVLTAVLRPVIFNNLLKAQGLPSDWIAGILDSEGVYIARTHAPEQFIGQKPSAALSGQIKKFMEGSVEAVTPDGIPVLNIYSRSPATGWIVVLSIPLATLEEEYQEPLRILAIGMFAVFALGLGAAWWAGNKIAFSIRALALPAQALGEGNAIELPEVSIKEASEVAHALSNASRLLHERAEALLQTNEALLAKDAELTRTHRLAKFGTWYWDLETDQIRESDSLRHLFGRDSIPSFTAMRGTVLSPDSWERVKTAVEQAVSTGVGYGLELEVIHGSGSRIWLEAKCETVLNDDGKVTALRGSVQDITERKRAEQQITVAETRFRSIFEQAAVGIALVGLDGKWLYVNDRLCDIVGYKREDVLGLTFQDITFADDLSNDLALVEQLIAGRIPNYSMEKRYVREDGSLVWVNLTVALIRTADDKPDYFVSVLEDIQRRKEAELALASERESRQQQLEELVIERTKALEAAVQDMNRLAHSDVLTGLRNRLACNQRLRAEFLRMKRTGRPYTVLMLDIDHFKRVNDTFGHETGDQVLKQLAQTLQGSIRVTDFVARFGGEEFLVLLPETEADGALTIAEKIRASIAGQAFPGVKHVTVSIGASQANMADGNEEVAVRRADIALYEAKGLGRNRVCFS